MRERQGRARKRESPGDLANRVTDEDRLTLEEVQAIRASLMPDDIYAVMCSAKVSTRIVAEGDSWFDYLPGLDILVQLRLRHGYSIHAVSEAGDTLENMAFGTDIDRNFRRKTPPLVTTLEAIAEHGPRVVLLSGGGNDFAGPEFEAFLNHKDSGLPPLRISYLKNVIAGSFRTAYEHIVAEIWKQNPSIHILLHGYAYPIPDGRGVINLPFGFRFVGPWLRPALAKKNIISRHEGSAILRQVIDEFNTMLGNFAATDSRIHYIDLRDEITPSDWVNELHLKNSAYGRVADIFHKAIQRILAD